MSDSVTIEVVDGLKTVEPRAWDALDGARNPFFSHVFLRALEAHGCLYEESGWFPRHLLLRDGDGELAAAVPAYVKTNSFGEFVFDWAWAGAYDRAGLRYYPKLVVGSPFSPVGGHRMLVREAMDRAALGGVLSAATVELAQRMELSSVHWLFVPETERRLLCNEGFIGRTGCQFHWQNAGYRDFDDYLGSFTARKRKKVKRERRQVLDAGIEVGVRHGHEISDAEIAELHAFYVSTFDKKGNIPVLSLSFFQALAEGLRERFVAVLAWSSGELVAGALNLRSDDTLFGRYWGCREDFHSLHFEACYYVGIDYCIRHGLHRFEPGAQGEHKISRGFLPHQTFSAHWIESPEFRPAISDFCQREARSMARYCEELMERSPFRDPAADAD